MSRSDFSRRLGNIVSLCSLTLLAIAITVLSVKDSDVTGAEPLPVIAAETLAEAKVPMVSPVTGKSNDADIASVLPKPTQVIIYDDGSCVGITYEGGSYDGDCSRADDDLPTISYHVFFNPNQVPPD